MICVLINESCDWKALFRTRTLRKMLFVFKFTRPNDNQRDMLVYVIDSKNICLH